MTRYRRLITASSALFLSLAFAYGQSTPTVQQKSEKSTCTNIIALTGNVNINCSNLTPEQKKLLERIHILLKRILANQDDSKALMDKMDEILRATSRPIESVNAPNGIGTIGGTLINPQVNNYVPPSRVLSAEALNRFTETLTAYKRGSVRVVLASTADDVYPLSQQICNAARYAQWGIACPMSRNSIMGHDAVAQGLECYSSSWESEDSVAFQNAMKAANLTCNYIPHAYNFGNGIEIGGPGGVTLLIGSPTQP
jgi:hypothetical protein